MNSDRLVEIERLLEEHQRTTDERKKRERYERRRAYDRALESLISENSGPTIRVENVDNPKNMLEEMISIQKHLDIRFAAKKNAIAYVIYGAGRSLDWLMGNVKNETSKYLKSDIELITEQRSLTKKILESFNKSERDIHKSYLLLEDYRTETAENLETQTKEYIKTEQDLEKLEQDETILLDKMSRATAASKNYAQLLHESGNIKLNRQKLVNKYERTAHAIKTNKTGLEDIAHYQLILAESEQVLGDASENLKQVSTQQSIAQAVVAAFVKGQTSMNAAYQVMESLSTNITATHRTIKDAFESLNNMALQISTGKTRAGTSTEPSKWLYGGIRNSRTPLTQDVHHYVRELFEKPAIDHLNVRKNGYHD